MDNTIYFPHANPVKFVVKNTTVSSAFNQQPLDAALYADTILSFQAKNLYNQKFQTSDTIYFQAIANYGPLSCKLVNCSNELVATATITTISNSLYTLPSVCYGFSIPLSSIASGTYNMIISIGTGAATMQLISEPIQIAETFTNTLLIQYKNSINQFGCIFQNGETFSIRVEGIFKDFIPGVNEVVYEDEPANLIKISATPFRNYKITFGTAKGIPDWLADRINRVFGCDNITINGVAYTRIEGGKMERNGDKFSPMAGWTLEVREALAKLGSTFINNVIQDGSITVSYDIEGTFFGVTNNNSIIILKKD